MRAKIAAILALGIIVAVVLFFLIFNAIQPNRPADLGTVNPRAFLPEKCVFPAGLSCIDWKVSSSSLMFMLQNSLGKNITVSSVVATSEAIQGGACSFSGETSLPNGASQTFTLSGCNFKDTENEKNRYDLEVVFTNILTGLQHTMNGVILATALS